MNHSRHCIRGLASGVAALALAHAANAQITFFERPDFGGTALEIHGRINDLRRYGFNDQASSAQVRAGRWEVCEDVRFEGHCVVLRPGDYDTLNSMGLNNRISSVRPAAAGMEGDTPPPPDATPYAFRRRPHERLIRVPVESARAVVGPPEERCWMEREDVPGERGEANVGGAIAGAVIGGILGHQIGGGVGKDLATAGGAVAGGVIGSNVGRKDRPATQRDVRRCQTVQDATPAYWDVRYFFRGQEHHMQTRNAPGPTILVNQRGEPRQ